MIIHTHINIYIYPPACFAPEGAAGNGCLHRLQYPEDVSYVERERQRDENTNTHTHIYIYRYIYVYIYIYIYIYPPACFAPEGTAATDVFTGYNTRKT